MAANARIITDEGLAQRIAMIIEPAIEALGFQLVRVRLNSNSGHTLQVMAERHDGTMGIDECTQIARTISPLLDVEDPIDHAYNLEVSSPGIDRPLVRMNDFTRYEGCEVKIELKDMRDGRKRYRGYIDGIKDQDVGIRFHDHQRDEIKETTVWLPVNSLKSAKLVMTAELIAFTEAQGLTPHQPDNIDAIDEEQPINNNP